MSALGWTQFALDIAGGFVRGTGSYIQKQNQYSANMAEASYNIKQLDLQLGRLLETYNENQAQLDTTLKQTLSQNNQALYVTSVAQKNAATTASNANVANQENLYLQLATLQRQNLQSVGSAVSAAARSGFRDSGSNRNIIEETERTADESYEQARNQITLSAYTSFEQAASDYFSANVQMESYRESSRNANENYRLQSSMLTSEYRYNKQRTEAERSYWQGVYESNKHAKNDFWQGVVDFFSGW